MKKQTRLDLESAERFLESAYQRENDTNTNSTTLTEFKRIMGTRDRFKITLDALLKRNKS